MGTAYDRRTEIATRKSRQAEQKPYQQKRKHGRADDAERDLPPSPFRTDPFHYVVKCALPESTEKHTDQPKRSEKDAGDEDPENNWQNVFENPHRMISDVILLSL